MTYTKMAVLTALAIPTGMAAGAEVLIDDSATIPLFVMVLCTIFVGGMAWRAGSAFQSLRDAITDLESRIKKIEDDHRSQHKAE